ncbi:MAG: outer membrane lipoprotein-sorting protein [Pseudomonadota bacterium]
MMDTSEQPKQTFAPVADFIVRMRWLWLALSVALVAVSLARIDQIWPPNPDARIFFAEENPDRVALDRFEETFNKNDNLIIAMESKSGEVFDPEFLAAVGEMTDEAWLLPFVRRVDSITNFQHTYAEGDDFITRDLVPEPSSVTLEEAAWAKATAMNRIELVAQYLPPQGSDVTQVQVLFTLPGVNPTTEVPSIAAEMYALRDRIEAKYGDVEVHLTGGIMINNQFARSGQEDGANLFGPMFLVILLIVGFAIRSIIGTLSVLILIILSALAGLGAAGWMGYQLNSVTVLSPLYIMTLAVASAVHVLASCRQTMIETADRKEWVRRALTDHMGAIIVACVTTAIGFFCLNFSISPPFRELGNIVGLGVLAGMVYSLTLLPALIIFLPIGRRTEQATASKAMEGLAEIVIANRKILLPGTLIGVAALALGISQLKLEDDFIRYFDERYEFRQDTDFVEDRLTGVNNLDFPLHSGEPSGINDPAFLAEMSALTDWLRAQPEITYVRSLTDTIKRLNMNMHGDDPSYMRLPTDRDEAAQYLFMYELSLNYGMDLTDQIDIDRETLRISAFMANASTSVMRDVTLRAGDWIKENSPIIQAAWEKRYPDVPLVTPTGIVHVFNLISYRDVRQMLSGTLLAIILISGIIMLTLRNLQIGVISLIPNLIPAMMAFGVWGYSVGAVTLAIAVVLAATLGIVVDDTVHFLSKYAKARKEGKSPEDAVRYTFKTVGMALFVTTVGLVGGFAVLAQSGFAVNGDMAKLTAVTITLALIADFLLLPALLIWIDKRRSPMTVPATATATILVALLGAAWMFTSDARAETPEEKGRAIAVEADKRDLGFGDFEADGEMVLKDKGGRESRRVFQNLTLERAQSELGDMGIIVFSKPRDIRGTALLTHANIEPKDDDQWIFLPAVKRVKRISSSNRTGKFVSSEFSYEDLGSQEVDDYTYKWLRDEPCPTDPALMCFVTESYPKNAKSGYSKRVAWTDQGEYRLMSIDFYNRRGDHEKTLEFRGYQQYLGKYWRADVMTMRNQQTGKGTDLVWSNYRFRTGLGEGDFSAQRLKSVSR